VQEEVQSGGRRNQNGGKVIQNSGNSATVVVETKAREK